MSEEESLNRCIEMDCIKGRVEEDRKSVRNGAVDRAGVGWTRVDSVWTNGDALKFEKWRRNVVNLDKMCRNLYTMWHRKRVNGMI